jgi:SagB-type dehydrogenase family enzyme
VSRCPFCGVVIHFGEHVVTALESSKGTQATSRRKKEETMTAFLEIMSVVGVSLMVFLSIWGTVYKSLPVEVVQEAVSLPPPWTEDNLSVTKALARRRSQRSFADTSLSQTQIGQLCWAAQGITDAQEGKRTAPSAGALYPLTVLVMDQTGVYCYEPQTHALRQVDAGDLRGALQAAALDQPCVGAAPLCLVITMDVARTASRYGSRAERYCFLEAGHVAQNVLLEATALGLAGVPVGAFDDHKVATLLHLSNNLRPVYLLHLGYPAGQ